MTRTWLDAVLTAAAIGGVVRAVVAACEGSCPRDVGAAMLVWPDRTDGTVGGGSLEHDVIAAARAMLAAPDAAWLRELRTYHLGPDLNQCCGGAATVLLERFDAKECETIAMLLAASPTHPGVARPVASGVAMQSSGSTKPGLVAASDGSRWFTEPLSLLRTPLFVYGAGHVARALVRVLDELPFAVTWVDIAHDRFPGFVPEGVRVVVDAAPETVVASGEPEAFHLVMTHSHILDEAIVAAVLRRGAFAYLGMIGSETKAARFRQRLGRAGFASETVGRLISPIGIPGLEGKAPATIAISVAADLLLRRSRLNGG